MRASRLKEPHKASKLGDGVSVPRFGRWLVLITVCALTLRTVVVLITQNEWVASDGFWYSVQANQMAHGTIFLNPLTGRPDALHPPAWVTVLTAFAWLGGHTWLQQQLLASVIGTAAVVFIGLAGRRIAGDRAGLVAAGVAALYAGLWVYERALLSETLLLPMIAVMILLAYRFRDRPSAKRAALLGAMCGLLALIRSEQILLVLFLLVPLIVAARGVQWRRRLGWLALATAALLVVLAPWTIYNLARFQQPVLLSTGLGYAAAGANCDASYYGANTGWTTPRCSIEAAIRTSRDVSVAEAQDRRAALTYAERHLGRLPIVLLAREGRAFGYWSPLRQAVLDSQLRSQWSVFIAGRPHGRVNINQAHPPSDLWVGRLALFSYWLLLLPAVAGGVVLHRRRIALYPLVAFLATIAVAAAVAFGDTRYRAGAEVALVLLAAIGIDAVLPSMRAPSSEGALLDANADDLISRHCDRHDLAERALAVPSHDANESRTAAGRRLA